MYPSLHRQVAQARLAGWHAQARRDVLVRAASRARRRQRHQSAHPTPALCAIRRMMLTVPSAGGP